MSLMIDYGVFYEFIPMDEFDKEQPTVVPLWGIETGENGKAATEQGTLVLVSAPAR